MGRAPESPTTNGRSPETRIEDLACQRERAQRANHRHSVRRTRPRAERGDRVSTVIVKRLPRRAAPDIPVGELVVDAPPEIPQATNSRWQQVMQLLPMLTGTIATGLLFPGKNGSAYSYVIGGIFGISTLGMLASSWSSSGPKKSEMMAARREYLRHLATLRKKVRDTADRQRVGLFYRHPDPDRLWSTVDSHRLWERRTSDADFGIVRVAVGAQTLATPLIPPVTRPLEDLEPMTAGALRRFLDAYSVVPDLPVAVSVRGFSRLYIRGASADRGGGGRVTPATAEAARGLVRAIIAQLAAFHTPDDMLIAVCTSPERRAEWEWVKWLPHNLHPGKTVAVGPVRHRATDGGVDGVTLLDIDQPPPRLLDRTMVVLDPSGPDHHLLTITANDEGEVGRADSLSRTDAEALARRMAPLRLAAAARSSDAPMNRDLGLPELLGINDPRTFDVSVGWAPRPHRDRLRVPIGIGSDGQPVELDLKESAQDGMGPHGLLIGATGSGKSEVLRTLVLALAASHSSETLNFVLVDFKGGATFTSLDRMPHVAAVITNLADELPLVDRMVDAINGELVRRQELLRRAGNYASLRDYEKARAGGAPLAPLPSLLIICDEFSELLTAKPDFIDLFVQIGRVGRSLGVHLLL